MLQILPTFRHLQDSDASGWTRSWPSTGRSHWTHADGATILVQRQRTPRTWDVQGEALHLTLPRTHRRGLAGDLGPLLHDVRTWTTTTDLRARQAIAHQVAAWLLLHGHMGRYICTLKGPEHGMVVRPYESPGGLTVQVGPAPTELLHMLQNEVQDLWSRLPIPDIHSMTVRARSGDAVPTGARHFFIKVPTTAHGRMHLLAQVTPELARVPPPRTIDRN